ncbi:hypothetical protein ScPMuIL_001501 [Solemya velum]
MFCRSFTVLVALSTLTYGAVSGARRAQSSCLQRADIVFLVDSSGSIGQNNFVKLQTFLKGIISKLDVGTDRVHVGVERFSSYPTMVFPLSRYTSTSQTNQAIDGIRYVGGGTNTADALRYMREQMFSTQNGARSNVPRIGVVITDGRSSNSRNTVSEADKARMNNIGLIAVGVGSGIDTNELHGVADDPDNSNTFTVNNFDQLNNVADGILQRACTVRATAASLTTSVPGQTHPPDPCQDSIPNCESYVGNVCQEYAQWAKDHCQRHCRFCQPLYTTAPPPCVDQLDNCANYQSDTCTNPAYKAWAKDNCRRYCGMCNGQCYYKGTAYKQGQKWTDGCDYECTCEDGNTGKYQCYNKCPVYYNLPAACTLVRSPSECCLKPVCDFHQSINSFELTAPATATTANNIHVCVYKSKNYYQGDVWEDGCDYRCTCTNSRTGLYKCQSRCATYALPNYCHLEKKAGECCSKPVCEFSMQQGSFSGMGSISGQGVATSPTTPPPCIDKIPNCAAFGQSVCSDPSYDGWSKTNCIKTCGKCNKCVYQGHSYSQGNTWKVGCDTQCTCENAIYGYYRCVNLCPTYNNIPAGCRQVRRTGDCCATIQCTFNGTFSSSSQNLGAIGNGGMIVQGNGQMVVPTIPSGGIGTISGMTGHANRLDGCLYKGQLYVQNQMWEDGCDFNCQCENGQNGLYTCTQRCPDYPNLPSVCHLESPPTGQCCRLLRCSTASATQSVVPVYQQTITGYGIVQSPSIKDLFNRTHTVSYVTVFPGQTVVPPTSPSATSGGGIGYCMYKGQKHLQSDSWGDGCLYNCVCEDASIGRYRCTERCPHFTNLPNNCQLVADPNDVCCKKIFCPVVTQTASFTGTAALITTSVPNICVYKGTTYRQDQSWYDGCEYKCTCTDSNSGLYSCMTRCPQYMNVPNSCTMVADPQDPGCCQVPNCHTGTGSGSTTGQGAIPTLMPGIFTGQGTGGTANIGFCLYKGQQHQQDDHWQDGCDYDCECQNARTGTYRCTERCKRYLNLPPQCRLVPDFANPCCQKPECHFNGVSGQITGIGTGTGSTGTGAGYCVYRGVNYNQGQTWYDGCDYKCRCDDASNALYACSTRCASYQTPLPSSCKMVSDPQDSCCLVPQCSFTGIRNQTTGSGSLNLIPTAIPGQISGSAAPLIPTPGPDGQTPTPITLSFCEYKGARYTQGQRWDDGCEYSCQCDDVSTGHYVCTEKCPRYVNLPPQCHLARDPTNPCCKKPSCDFTGSPGQISGQGSSGGPSVGPNFTPTAGPGQTLPTPYPTPALPRSVCVYKGRQFTQGQQWYDGCDYSCECENADTGIYRCSQRCSSISRLPAQCTLVQDPRDPLCCRVPECHVDPSLNQTVGYIIPTAPPGTITGGSVSPTPSPFLQPTAQPGHTLTPTPAPGSATTPSQRNVCVYKSKQYSQDQRWQDGCDFNCQCVSADTGLYRCTERCPRYVNLPRQCSMVRDYTNPCCQKPYCDFRGTQGQVTPVGQTPTPGSGHTPTLGPGQTPTPGPNTGSQDACVYNGVPFKQGQTWEDGCDLRCSCENQKAGFYRCYDRCAKYSQVPASCVMQTDPRDSCCRVPVCAPYLQPTAAPSAQPSLGPGQTPDPNVTPTAGSGGVPTMAPSKYPIPTAIPGIITGVGITPTPGPNSGVTPTPGDPSCLYMGVAYHQGQKWQDGCTYDCECIDASTGRYRCKERCPLYMNIPSYCRLVVDTKDPCCKIPECRQPSMTPTPAPTFGPGYTGVTQDPSLSTGHTVTPIPGTGTTLAPTLSDTHSFIPADVCIYNNMRYTQGQQWYNGCDKVCVCEDGKSGYYRCSDRCTKYQNLPSQCTMVADPNDPVCCQVPQCIPGLNGSPTPTPGSSAVPQVYTNPPGVVTGQGTPPTPTPATGASPSPRKEVCIYKGKEYAQGRRWQDGCDYNCVCEDGTTGRYKCQQRCGTVAQLPPQCSLRRDSRDFCCFEPVCDWTQTVPTRGPFPHPTLTPGTGPTPSPGTGPTLSPTVSPTPSGPTPLPAFCVYQGIPFRQGQEWNEGCTQKCRCDDASRDYYTCFDRCPSYSRLPAGCVMVTDPSDACCQIPQCNIVPTAAPTAHPNVTPTPGTGPTPNPNLHPTPLPTPQPSPIPTAVPGVIIGSPSGNTPSTRTGNCYYKGGSYNTGDQWNDGCSYQCECIDDSTGQYKCTERCARYVRIPSYCTMVADPADSCCKKPYCPYITPTATPTPGSGNFTSNLTPIPGGTGTLTPTITPTPRPQTPLKKDSCVMNNRVYTQGQQWYDGCDKVCVCVDGKTGFYKCSDRCLVFQAPANCILVPDPKDPICCQMPQCTPTANTSTPTGVIGSFIGNGQPPVPTPNTNVSPSPGGPTPSFQTVTPTPHNVPTPGPGLTYPPGMIPSGRPTQTPTFTVSPGQPTSGPNPTGSGTTAPVPALEVCIYKNRQYTQGQKWRDGCDYDCVCEDGVTGSYRCSEICPRYPNLPMQCRMVHDPMNPCCSKPDCTSPTPSVGPTPGSGVTGTPSLGPGISPTPRPTPQGSGNPNPSQDICVYNGVPFKSGQNWQVGCDEVCRCENQGQVVCDDRCPTFPALTAGCRLMTDPHDQCCQVPLCSPVTNPDPNTSGTVIPGIPGTISGQKQPDTNNPRPVIGQRDQCVYHGRVYSPGQQWDDGCTYNCECIGGSAGQYRCTQRCAQHPSVPSYCTMVQDPQDQCCHTPYCPSLVPTGAPSITPTPRPGQPTGNPSGSPSLTQTPNITPTAQPGHSPTPGSGVSPTPAPQPKDVCVYGGQYYQQGQMWYDNCNAVCRCEDADAGFYRCQERCARYTNVPSACTMVPDPKDPSCCQVPQCPLTPQPGVTPTPGYITGQVTARPGIITGIGQVPLPTAAPTPQPGRITPTPAPGGTTPTAAPRKGCFFKGVVYSKNQQWDDGCQYDCVCLDDMSGQYRCTEKCARYPSIDMTRCVLIQDPNEPCCKVPYCDFVNPTPFPNGIPTPRPTIQPSPGGVVSTSNPRPTPRPTKPTINTSGYCVYKGVFYTQKQQWDDGCTLRCVCDDSSTGYYTCKDRCQAFQQVSPTCQLRTDPNDPCCLVPDCSGSLTGQPGSGTSGQNPVTVTANPVTGPGMTGTVNPATGPGISGTNSPYILAPSVPQGSFTGIGSTNPSGIYSPQYGTLTGARAGCVYNGQVHAQSDTWSDGCQYNCECIDATRGRYKCTDRCPKYYYLPAQCHFEQDPKDSCCQLAKCIPTFMTTSGPNVTPTLGPGHTHSQVITPTGTPQPGVDVCVYKDGHQYRDGETWDDGCELMCVCDDASQNKYKCSDRCQSFSSLPSFCTLVRNQQFQCCFNPQCTLPNGQTLNPLVGNTSGGTGGIPPTLGPQVTNVLPIGTHSGFSGSGRPIDPTTGQVFQGMSNRCVYKNTPYTQGQSWDDGCDYVCTCEVSQTGQYKCVSKCPQYGGIPSYCHLTTIPGQCCPSLSCNIPGYGQYNPIPQLLPTMAPTAGPGVSVTPSTSGIVGGSVIVGPVSGSGTGFTGSGLPGHGYHLSPGYNYFTGNVTTQCIYDSKIYNQGESWNDGCDYTCECLDGRSGYYRCEPRCASYSNLPQSCYMVNTTGQCCGRPMCRLPSGAVIDALTGTGQTGLVVVGSYSGGFTGLRPGYIPGFSGTSGQGGSGSGSGSGSSSCLCYKGVKYQQNAEWDDGCDYRCRCVNSQYGQYRCQVMCPAYTSLPSVCRLLQPVSGQCCQTLRCQDPSVTQATPVCRDKLPNCAEYGASSCTGQYIGWATENCNMTCGICSDTNTQAPCVDALANCPQYGQASCSGVYRSWAEKNCRQYCHLCPDQSTLTAVPPTVEVCADKLTNCPQYGQDACKGSYLSWATENCRAYCGLCQGYCYYKGQTYGQGATWIDGCDYNCTCLNGASGYYQCLSLCPNWTNLPQGCSVVKRPGECCGEVKCVTQAPQTGCVYKGHRYGQDERFDDGCTYSCQCVDAVQGRYSCREKCVTWSLPSSCRLDPVPAGKCCQKPVCPSNVIMNVPAGYENEYSYLIH